MFELIYTSVAPQGLSDSELHEILEESRLKNQRIGITGMLIYSDREIMQLLEGEEEVVKKTYQVIQSDQRHTHVEVSYQGPIESRAFSDWSMAFKKLDEDSCLLIPGYEALGKGQSPINLIKENSNRGKKTFLNLRDKLEK